MRLTPFATTLGAILAITTIVNAAATDVSSHITAAVADPSRSQAQVDTDLDRKPGETFAFAGVKPGMRVGEMFPGGGYFTHMLSDSFWPPRARSCIAPMTI